MQPASDTAPRDPASDDPATLVSTEWLHRRLGAPDTRVLDASWYLPDMRRDGRAEYDAAHIPGARFLDIDEVSDGRSALPHMAPPIEKFMSRMRRLGVGDGHTVVIYDGAGLFTAARIWWLFRLFGQRAAVLDGGFPKWRAEGRPVTAQPPVPRERHMTAERRPGLLRDVTEVSRALKLGEAQLVDARPSERFAGAVPEPRPGLRAGHVPGSRSLPFPELLAPDGTMKDAAGLRAAFEAAGVDLARPVITTCGSGVTAAILNLALARLGHEDHSLYDGSWAEWGMYDDLAVETGPPRPARGRGNGE
jgi:thiosulfate/3-mercaptopyruvate sulfurtransferase